MDSLGNVNYAISSLGCQIFDSKYEKSLVLNRESLDMICAPSVGEDQVATYETVFYYVRYNFLTVQPRKEQYIYQLNNLFIHYINRIKIKMDG